MHRLRFLRNDVPGYGDHSGKGVTALAERVLMKGNEARAEAAIQAGCRHFFGYPVTPQTDVYKRQAQFWGHPASRLS